MYKCTVPGTTLYAKIQNRLRRSVTGGESTAQLKYKRVSSGRRRMECILIHMDLLVFERVIVVGYIILS